MLQRDAAGGGSAGGGGSCGSRSFCIAEVPVVLPGCSVRVDASGGAARWGSASPARTVRAFLVSSPSDSHNGHEYCHTCFVAVGCWADSCPVPIGNVSSAFSSFVAGGGQGGRGEPCGRDAPNTKVSLRVRICFDSCTPICRRDGAAVVLILEGVGPCQETD